MKFYKSQTFIITVTFILSVVMMMVFIAVTGMGKVQYQKLNDRAVGTVTDDTGAVAADGLSSEDWIMDYRDELTIDLTLPDEAPYPGSNSLVFFVYNANVDVFLDGNRIASNGGDQIAESSHLIGHSRIIADIPPNAFGDHLEIRITSYEKVRTSFNADLYLIRSSEAGLLPLSERTFPIIVFTFVGIASMIIVIEYLVQWFIKKKLYPGLYLFLFSMLLSVWYIGYHDGFYVFCSNERFDALVEYYALYSSLIPVMVYFAIVSKNTKFRRFYEIMAAAYAVCAGISVVASVTSIPLDLSMMTRPFRALCVIMVIGFAFRAFRLRGQKEPSREKMTLIGLASSMLIAILEIAAIVLRSIAGWPAWFEPLLYIDYVFIGILIFISILFIHYLANLHEELLIRTKEEELSRLAFVDQLTGIPNRAFISTRVGRMKNVPDDFTAVFMDVDHLKEANDFYGHEVGDHLICTAADAIRIAFEKCRKSGDLYGRWGGDEFIAFFSTREDADRFSRLLQKEFDDLNRQHAFSFHIAVSVGMASGSDSGNGQKRTPQDLLAMADQSMYQRKAVQHESERENRERQEG